MGRYGLMKFRRPCGAFNMHRWLRWVKRGNRTVKVRVGLGPTRGDDFCGICNCSRSEVEVDLEVAVA